MLDTILPSDSVNYATVRSKHRWQKLNSLDYDEVLEVYRRHGAILFRGFRWSVQDFDTFGKRFCSSFVSNKSAGRRKVTSDQRVQTVDMGGTFLPLHPEMSREPWKPDVAFFACVKPPRKAGETSLCDGVALANSLRAETREFLENTTLLYTQPSTRKVCELWLDIDDPDEEKLKNHQDSWPFVFSLDKNGNFVRTYAIPALHKPLFSDEKAYGNYIVVARFLHNIRNFPTLGDGSEIPEELCHELRDAGLSLSVAHKWQKRDILMVDNTRFMHAREQIINPEKRIILTQFGFLRDAPVTPEEFAAQRWRHNPIWVEAEVSEGAPEY